MPPSEGSVTVGDALAFIAENPHVYLLAHRPDGYPTGYAMMARVRDGFVEFSTYRASAKVGNLLRDGVAGVLALSEENDGLVLFAEGPVTVVEGSSWADPIAGSGNGAGPQSPSVPIEVTEKVRERHGSGKRMVLRVALERASFSLALGPDE
jgi:hypothetical protein